jgi:hypothetical protein
VSEELCDQSDHSSGTQSEREKPGREGVAEEDDGFFKVAKPDLNFQISNLKSQISNLKF